MAKHEQSNRSGEYRSGEYRNGEYRNGEYRNSEYSPRSRDKSQDRSRDRSRDRHERDRRRRRHRSPSYDSYSSSDSDDSGYSRSPSPRRPSRRHTSAAIYDDEDRGHRTRGRDHRRRPTREYHSEESRSRERGGIVEDLLGAIGLIQAKNKGSRGERSRSDEDGRKTTRDALQAALTAAAMEAFRTRKEGKLTPQRLMQIAGAAIAAGGLDALVDRNGGNGGSMKSIIESVVAGLATGKTMGKTVKHKRDGSVGDKVGTGFVGLAAKTLARSLSQGPTRRRTSKN